LCLCSLLEIVAFDSLIIAPKYFEVVKFSASGSFCRWYSSKCFEGEKEKENRMNRRWKKGICAAFSIAVLCVCPNYRFRDARKVL